MDAARRFALFALVALGLNSAMAEAATAAPSLTRQPAFAPCSRALPTLADFDTNGVLDRVDAIAGQAGVLLRLTLNGTHSIVLAASSEACGLVVTDLDRDADLDLVAFTHTGSVLVWRNNDGLLNQVRAGGEPSDGDSTPTLHRTSHQQDSIDLDRRPFASMTPSMCPGIQARSGSTNEIRGCLPTALSRGAASRAPPAR